MKEFLLLFRGGDAQRIAEQQTPELWQAHMMKWKAWMEKLGSQGKLVGGQPLDKEGGVIKGKKKVVTDGPFAESKEIVGGYLMIKAGNLKEAIELSKECPIFEHDGTVEIREIQPLQM